MLVEGLGLTVTGIAGGLAGALAIGRALAALLFVTAALIASYLPDRRALDVDPVVAIRE